MYSTEVFYKNKEKMELIMSKKTSKIKVLILNILALFAVVTSSFIYPMQDRGSRSDWPQIKELYLPSLLKQDPQHQKEEKEENKKEDEVKDHYELLLEAFASISDEEKVKLAFDLFAKSNMEKNQHNGFSRIVDDTTYRDLNIFCGNPGNVGHNFVKRTNKTQTVAGTLSYLNLLYHPLDNIDQLRARQNGVRELVYNEFLYRELSEKLKKLAQAESKVLACWHEEAQRTIDAVMKRFYVKDPIPCPQIPSLGNQWLKGKMAGTNTWISKYVESFNKWLSKIANQSSKYLDAKRVFQLATKPFFDAAHVATPFSKQLISLIANNPLLILSDRRLEGVVLNSLLLAGTWYLPEEYKINVWRTIIGSQCLYYTIQSYKYLHKDEKASLMLHKVMNKIAAFMVITQEIIDLVKCYPKVNDAVSTCMQNYNQKSLGYDNLETFINLLDKDCFKKEPRLLGLRGAALATFSLLKQMKDDFIPYYVFIGNIDALMSIATLLKETNESSDNYYTYACYTKAERPFIALYNFWNPFINPDEAIPNNMTLDKNVILTGPNAGGKSTALKAIALSALLAQTLTITPGEVKLTPFSKIITLLNINDTPGEASGFQAHAQRVKFVFDTINTMSPHEFALLVPDELYNTTEEDIATALCSGIFKLISDDFPNALFIAATHYTGLNTLERETNGRIKNYKMIEAHVAADGSIYWSYKIEPGINRQNIALQIAQQLYGDGNEQSKKILREAQRKLKQPERF